jgi:hypothetical protein
MKGKEEKKTLNSFCFFPLPISLSLSLSRFLMKKEKKLADFTKLFSIQCH